MVNLCEDLLAEILRRLSEEDLLKCQSVSKSWHPVISRLWVQRFWTLSSSPVLGLYFRTTTAGMELSRYLQMMTAGMPSLVNYISLYDYSFLEDNLERNPSTLSSFLNMENTQIFRHWQRGVAEEYLDCCNGLLLIYKSTSHQLYVCNPITRRQFAIPKASDHHRSGHFWAALAFDPCESPSHYRVVRVDYSCSFLDIFSSHSGRWVRHKLDPDFTELCRGRFVYLRGILYSIASSGEELLCIHLDTTVQSRSFQLPESVKCRTHRCLGVSMDLLCYFFRDDESNMFHVWSYDDRQSSDEWVLRFSISCEKLRWLMLTTLGYDYPDTPETFEPYAISPSSDIIFFGTPRLILSYNFNTLKIKFVCKTGYDIAASPVFALRACFLPLYQLGKRNGGCTPCADDSLGEELPCDEELEEEEDGGEIQLFNIKLFSPEQKRLILPSELHRIIV